MTAIAELTEDFNGAAVGADILVANSTFDNISGTAAAPKYNASSPGGSFKSGRVTSGSSGTTLNKILRMDFTASATVWLSFYFYAEARSITTNDDIVQVNTGLTTRVARLVHTKDGFLQLIDNLTTVWTSPSALATGQWHRIEFKCTPGSATGLECKVYSGANLHTTTTSQASGQKTATAYGGGVANANRFLLGLNTGADGAIILLGHIRGDNASAPAPIDVGPPAPTVNAGADQTTPLEAGDTFTLTATSSETSVTWSQISGPTAVLTGSGLSRTGTAPGDVTGGAMVFRATATNVTGTATDDVSVGPVVAITERAAIDGVRVPVILQEV